MHRLQILLTLYSFAVGLCFGSFALASAWRIKKQKTLGGTARSVCEHCGRILSVRDLIPLYSWMVTGGKCRYCRKKLSVKFPLSELAGGLFFGASYYFWPVSISGFYGISSFVTWSVALILLLILFFYDIQWFTLPNKVMYPLWFVSAADFALRFAQKPTLYTVLLGAAAVAVGAGIFWLFWKASKGTWIGYGDVRLGVAIGLLIGTPAMAALVIFAASLIGVFVALPGLVTGSKKMSSKIPFGPLLIIALVLVRLFGQKTLDWYTAHLLFI